MTWLAVLSALVVCSPLVTSVFVSDHPDRVWSIPGFNEPLPSPWYSGYLDYELEGIPLHTHYVFVEAEQTTQDDMSTKPIIYWSNGGPGFSSMFGLLTELGPLILSDLSQQTDDYKSTGIPTPIYNPYSWTRLGSILLIDAPAPVGFSYCDNITDSSNPNYQNPSCLAWTDELASRNAYLSLQAFYRDKFPSLLDLPLFLTGESYAGIYIPTLARRIYRGDDDNAVAAKLQRALKGLAVGDGCLGTQTGICGVLNATDAIPDYWGLLFMAGHNQIPHTTFRNVLRACRIGETGEFLNKEEDPCRAAVRKARDQAGGFFAYALYDECTYENLGGASGGGGGRRRGGGALVGGALNDYPCGADPVMFEWLGSKEIQKAFHVTSAFFSADNAVGFNYTPTEPDLRGFYREINGKLRVLIYNGDTDPAITVEAAQNWTSNMGFRVLQDWGPWTKDNCRAMGGYVTRYEGDFDFLTIRGAGHMVPTYKPEATFTFIKAWLEETEYPTYDVSCTSPDLAEQRVTMNGEVDDNGVDDSVPADTMLRKKEKISKRH